jgi:predicted transcriptional regulator
MSNSPPAEQVAHLKGQLAAAEGQLRAHDKVPGAATEAAVRKQNLELKERVEDLEVRTVFPDSFLGFVCQY